LGTVNTLSQLAIDPSMSPGRRSLRKQAMGVFTQPPTGSVPQSPILSGPFV
jgi:hypothetical protein